MLTYRSKFLLDRIVGFPISIILAVLARIAGIILHRDHRTPENPKSIVVAKFLGMGSIIYVGVLCRSLKRRFPSAKMYFVTTKGCGELAKKLNYIDEVITIDDSSIIRMISTNICLIIKLWMIRPKLYFDMEVYSNYAAIITTLSLALNRYGFYRKSVAFKKGLYSKLIFFNTRRHISDIYLHMCNAVGATGNADLSNLIAICPEDREKLSKLLKTHNFENNRIILVNVNASDLLLERRWPNENWTDYLDKVAQNCSKYTFLMVGAPNEKDYVNSIWQMISQPSRDRIKDISGLTDLGTLLALIMKSELLITIDSGTLHMAVSLGTRTLSLWGPGAPDHYAPLEDRHDIIYEPTYCSPCLYHADVPPCNGNNICMAQITVNKLWQKTESILSCNKISTK